MNISYLNHKEAGDVVDHIVRIVEQDLLVPLRVDVPLDHQRLHGFWTAVQEDGTLAIRVEVRVAPSKFKIEAW